MRCLSASDFVRDGRAINFMTFVLSSLACRVRDTILITRQNYLNDPLSQIRKKWSGDKGANKAVRDRSGYTEDGS